MRGVVGQPYRKYDPSESFDAIVIGSGVGGMTAAALLARHGGKRVLVLERHYMPGGFTQVFGRRGYRWDVGLHYVGQVADRQSLLRRLMDHLTRGQLEWTPMGEVYDRVVIGERSYDLVTGRDRFAATLKRSFPREGAAIDRYLRLVDKVAGRARFYFAEKVLPGALAPVLGPLLRTPFLRWARRTTGEVLADLTDDRELAAVLTGQFGDYGLPPGRGSFAIQAILTDHYLEGAGYPVGGSAQIASSIAPSIEEAGGRVLYYADVAEILVDGNRAAGVRMADGTEIAAPLVISDAGARNTFSRLLPRPVAQGHGLLAPLDRLEPSCGHACVYVGLRATAAELGLPKHNYWIYPDAEHDANCEAYARDPEAPLPLIFLSFPSAKDPTFEERHPGRATIEVMTFAHMERFERWSGSAWRKRGGDYDAAKGRLGDRMLEVLHRHLPQVRGKIDYHEVSTPLSTRHFANAPNGEIYGLAHSPRRFEQTFLRPRTPVGNLYLTGQDVLCCGVAAAMTAGYLTASVILRRNLVRAAERDSSSIPGA